MKVNITKDSDFKINPAIRYGATSRVDQLISSDYNEKQESSLLLLDNDPRVKFYISFINPQLLASVLNDDSIFEYLEILKCLKEQDLVRVLDFDLWNYSKDKSTWLISGDRFSHWVSAWRNISPSFSASRVFDIPEEMIVPLMRSVFEIIAIGIGQEPFSDDWTITPDNRFYYKVNAAFDTETQNIFTNLVKDIYEEDFL